MSNHFNLKFVYIVSNKSNWTHLQLTLVSIHKYQSKNGGGLIKDNWSLKAVLLRTKKCWNSFTISFSSNWLEIYQITPFVKKQKKDSFDYLLICYLKHIWAILKVLNNSRTMAIYVEKYFTLYNLYTSLLHFIPAKY